MKESIKESRQGSVKGNMKGSMKGNMQVKAEEIIATMLSMGDERQREILMRFFKTGKGDYGEGDRFLGIKVPDTRMVVKEAKLRVALDEIETLLESEWHEVRLCGFLLLVEEMKAALPKAKEMSAVKVNETIIETGQAADDKAVRAYMAKAERREEIARFYLRHAQRANNWDLVDMSCPKILGQWLLHPQADGSMPDRQILYQLAASDNLWEQRIAMVTCWMLIRADQYDDTLHLATILLPHPHDLMHKAVGWMLREVGKRDMPTLEAYLTEHVHEMHRTSLRYAIEKMNETKRYHYMHLKDAQ